MHNDRTVAVTVNVCIHETGYADWFVTTAEELQTTQWNDDGGAENVARAIEEAIRVARRELQHFARGGRVAYEPPT